MGRPKGEEKERRWIPVRLLAEVDAILGRGAPAVELRHGPAVAVEKYEFKSSPPVLLAAPRTQPVAKPSPFEARAAKRAEAPTIKTNEFGDTVYDD